MNSINSMDSKNSKDWTRIVNLLNDPDYSLWVMMLLTRRVMASARESELKEYGVTSAEASVLFMVQVIEHAGRRPTPTELSRWLYQKPHSISELLNRMTKRGLVRVVAGPDGANSRVAVLTDKGQQIFDDSYERRSVHNIMSCLSSQEREQLWACLHKLRHEAVTELGLKQVAPWPHNR